MARILASPILLKLLDVSPSIVQPKVPVEQVLEELRQARRRYVLVGEPGQLQGIFTKRDAVRWAATPQPNVTVDQVISGPLISLRATDYLNPLQVLALLRQHRIRQLPVLDERDRLMGVITLDRIRQALQPGALLRLRQVKEVMTTTVILAPPEASVRQLAERMAKERISCLLILSSGLAGIVTESDILRCLGEDLDRVTAEAIMSSPVRSVRPQDSLWLALQQMEQHGIRCLAVVEAGGPLVGILTQSDLTRLTDPVEMLEVMEAMQSQIDQLKTEKDQLLQTKNTLLADELCQRRQVEETHRAIISGLPDLVMRVRADGIHLDTLSPGAMRLLCPDIAPNTSIYEILPQEQADERMGYVRRALQTGTIQTYEYQLKIDGTSQYEEARIVPISEQEVLIFVRDITARKQAECRLQHSEARYRALVEGNPDMLIRVNRDGICLDFKPHRDIAPLFPPETYIGKTAHDLYPPEFADRVAAGIKRALETGETYCLNYETLTSTTPGQREYREGRYIPVGQDEVLVLVRDITELKQAELALQASEAEAHKLIEEMTTVLEVLNQNEARFRALIENAAELILSLNPDGSITYASPAVQRILELTPLWVTGKRLSEFVHPEDARTLERLLQEALEHPGLPRPTVEFRVQAANGSWRDLQVKATNLLTEAAVGGIVLNCSDCTEAKRDAQALQQVNAELEYQINVRNADLRRALDHEALLRLITDEVRDGLDEEQILLTALRELTLGLDLGSCDVATLDPDGQTYRIRHEYTGSLPPLQGSSLAIPPEIEAAVRRGGTIYCCLDHPLRGWITLLCCPIRDAIGQLGLLKLIRLPQQTFSPLEARLAEQVANQMGIAMRQARLYQAAQTQVHRLEQVNRLKDELVHRVSHEIRAPLTNTRFALHMLENLDRPERKVRYLNILKHECERANRLVNELLELQALELGSTPLAYAHLCLAEWIPAVVEPFRLRAQEQRQALSLELAADLPEFVTDSHLLEQILAELLNNACKYTPSQEQISLQVAASGLGLRIQVSNSGVDLPPDALPRLFEPFYRIQSLDPERRGGSGLGLALVKKAVERLGGSIGVQAAAGLVSFIIELPALSL